MSMEKTSASSLASPRNLLIAGAVLLLVGGGAVAVFASGQGKSVMTADASANTPVQGFASGDKQGGAAANVKSDWKPSADKAPIAPKTSESKNVGVADNTLASVKNTSTMVADNNPLNVISYGSTSAPITIIEYGSLACPHCAEFDAVELPKIKANYIDKGLVRLIFRPYELPQFNGIDAYAALLALCLQPERRTAMIEMLYRQQMDWIPYNTPPAQMKDKLFSSLKNYGRNAGLSDATVDQCLSNQANQNWLGAVVAQGDKDGVDGTPKFFINGEKTDNMSFEDWQKKLNAILAKKRS